MGLSLLLQTKDGQTFTTTLRAVWIRTCRFTSTVITNKPSTKPSRHRNKRPMPSEALPDLSGQVKKTDPSYFASGGLADIWKGQWTMEAKEGPVAITVAIKVIRGAWRDPEYLDRLQQKLIREGKVWRGLQHPFVTPFYGVCYDLDRSSIRVPSLICPYYVYGDLARYLESHPEANKMKLVIQVASGLDYLHGLNPPVVHGDMKASNILVNDNFEASITDFGLSRILESSGFTTKTVGGTCRWMAYELLAPCEDDDDEEECVPLLTTESDVWAFGMTVVEILTGRLPFSDIRNDSAVILTVLRERDPHPSRESCTVIADDLWSMLLRCWDREPHHRPSLRRLSLVLNITFLRPLSVSEVEQLIDEEDRPEPHFTKIESQDDGAERNNSSVDFRPQAVNNLAMQSEPIQRHPHPCRWVSCREGFTRLETCQQHELEHFERWRHGKGKGP